MQPKKPKSIHSHLKIANPESKGVLDSIRRKYDLSWKEFFHQLATYPVLVEKAMELPPEVNQSMLTNVTTVTRLIPLWINSIAENITEIRKGRDIKDIPHTTSPALVIGAGPSLHCNRHLDLLAKKKFDGIIFASDRVLKDCLDVGVIPDYVMILDGNEKVLRYIDHDMVDSYADRISAIMCVTTHPDVVKRWTGKKYFFIQHIEDNIAPNVSYIFNELTGKSELITAGHVSSVGWVTAFELGCNPVVLTGVDLSYFIDTPIENTQYFNMYKDNLGDIDEIKKHFTTFHHPAFGTDCYYDDMFNSYLFNTMNHFKFARETGIEIINCTEGGAIDGEGVKCQRLEDYLDNQIRNL